MTIQPLRRDLVDYLQKRNLTKQWSKQSQLFESNPLYPSLHTELLEPKHLRLYSFRINRKYRAIFIYAGDDKVEVIDINDHYQ